MAPLLEELSPQTTERFRHNYTVSLIKMQSHRGHLGKLLFKRMAELGGVQAADQLDPGALHHKTFMGQGEQSPHIQQRGIPLAVTASVASITEPIDFLFCFVSPLL